MSQDGTARVIGFFPASDETNGLYISAGVATDPVYASTNRLLLQNALVALVGIVAAFMLARFTSHIFIGQPFQRLISTVEDWEKDDLASRTHLGTDLAEFGRAGRLLDRFMDQLTFARAARREAQEQRDLLTKEMDHRVKNLIATIQAVAMQTFRGKGVDPTLRSFTQRLQAMATAHDALHHEGWKSAPILTIVDESIDKYVSDGRSNFDVVGPPVMLRPQAAMAFSMTLHELCTNAAKYDALSVENGVVSIHWWIDEITDPPAFNLEWREGGGPPVVPPTSTGFGSVMIQKLLASQIRGSVSVRFDPTGLVCTVTAPSENVILSDAIDGVRQAEAS